MFRQDDKQEIHLNIIGLRTQKEYFRKTALNLPNPGVACSNHAGGANFSFQLKRSLVEKHTESLQSVLSVSSRQKKNVCLSVSHYLVL